MPTSLEQVCCYKIPEVKAFHLKSKARLSCNKLLWNFLQNLPKISVKEIISKQSFSLKFLRYHFLVLVCNVSKNDSFTGILQLFYLSLNISKAYQEPIQTSKMRCIQNLVKHLRWNFLQKQLTVPKVYQNRVKHLKWSFL